MNEKGRLIWRILFGVVMAALLLGIFLAYVSTQQEYQVGAEAQSLANGLSKTAFSAISQQQATYDLPRTVGEANYEIEVENNTFIVRITGGEQKGREYRSSVGVDLSVQPPLPEPDNTLYAQGRTNKVVMASAPLELPEEELRSPQPFDPPEFYEFAKENPREATAIISSYYHARQEYSEKENLDIEKYKWESENNENNLKAQVTSEGNPLAIIRVLGHVDKENVGYIENTWTVTGLKTLKDELSGYSPSPSIRDAHLSKWLYTPSEAKVNLQGRTWVNTENEVVTVPGEINPTASTVTTNVSTYPTWRFEFQSKNEHYISHFTAMAWEPSENKPGFVFESEPDLEARR